MYKKYTSLCPPMGCGVVERHLEMAQPTKKLNDFGQRFKTGLVGHLPSCGRAIDRGSKTILAKRHLSTLNILGHEINCYCRRCDNCFG